MFRLSTTQRFLVKVAAAGVIGLSSFFLIQMVFIPFVQKTQVVEAVVQLPTDPFELGEYYFNVGNSIDGTYDLKKARHYYEQAIATDPKAHEIVWYQLGRIDFLEGSFDAALYKFQKQIEYFPAGPYRVYYMIGLTNGYKARNTKRVEDWDAAAAGFIAYLEHDSASPWARTDLSWVYFAQGKYAEMRPVLELGIALHPEHPWLLNMYGLYLLNTNRSTEAAAYFDRAVMSADALTVDDWGMAYPGNNPLFWADGLSEFREVVAHNRTLIAE
jgi:tetratricopeptide (TPR) repeat protein